MVVNWDDKGWQPGENRVIERLRTFSQPRWPMFSVGWVAESWMLTSEPFFVRSFAVGEEAKVSHVNSYVDLTPYFDGKLTGGNYDVAVTMTHAQYGLNSYYDIDDVVPGPEMRFEEWHFRRKAYQVAAAAKWLNVRGAHPLTRVEPKRKTRGPKTTKLIAPPDFSFNSFLNTNTAIVFEPEPEFDNEEF
jgi:hypothetical protein